MKKILIVLICNLVTLGLYAQSDPLVNAIVRISEDIQNGKNKEADSLFKAHESEYLANPSDTSMALYFNTKATLLFFHEQKYKDCIPLFKETISLLDKINIKHSNYLYAFQYIAMSYHLTGDVENAERYYRKALIKSVTAGVPKDFRPMIYKNLGILYENKGDTLLARECYKRVKESDNVVDVQKWSYLDWSESMWEKVNQLRNNNRFEEAVVVLDQIIARIRSENSVGYEELISALYTKAITISRFLNHFNEAIPVYDEILSYSRVAKSDENICGAFCNLALCQAYMHKLDEALQTAEAGEKYIDASHSMDFIPQSPFRFAGNGAYWAEDFKGAIPFYKKYLSAPNTRGEGNSYQEIANQLSVCYIKTAKPELAQNLLENLLKTDGANLKKNDEQSLALVYHNLGRACMLQGNYKIAHSYLKQSAELQKKLYNNVIERTTNYINECLDNIK